MSSSEREIVYDGGQLFRVEHQPIPGREKPFEFVHRIGSVTVLPVISGSRPGSANDVLAIHNTRMHYGASTGLPCGNLDGRFDNPEDPDKAALRELLEETGYGYPEGVEPDMDVFELKKLSQSINYRRYFAVARGVKRLAEPQKSAYEQIQLTPMSLRKYVLGLMELRREDMYSEVNAAFAKAGMALGREAVYRWVGAPTAWGGQLSVEEQFRPWLTKVESTA